VADLTLKTSGKIAVAPPDLAGGLCGKFAPLFLPDDALSRFVMTLSMTPVGDTVRVTEMR